MHRKMLRRTCSVTAMEIKPREMAFSVAIVFVMLALGFLIGSKIGDHIAEENEKFTTAAQITADEQFQYALATDFGNVIAYGNLIAEQPGWVETENLSAGNDTPINEKVSVLSSSRFTLSHVQYISVRVYVCPFPSVDVTTRVCMVYRSVILVSCAYSPSKSSAETGCSAIRLP